MGLYYRFKVLSLTYMNLKKLASTKTILHGFQHDSLVKENEAHERLLTEHQGSNYTFPSLSCPISSIEAEDSDSFNFPNSIQWCHDGSSLVTASEDNGIRLYITSPTLLEDDDAQLLPFLRSFRPTPIICSDIHPKSSIYDTFCASLVAAKDVPLKLMSLIPDDEGNYQNLKSFQIQSPQTEEFLKIHSIKFLNDDCFASGSNKLISIFNINRSDSLSQFASRAGITSCITPARSEFAANGGFYTGSFSKKVQMYDCDTKLIQATAVRSGNRITQILESSNGKYLYAISRNSMVLDVLDIRMGLEVVTQLQGVSSSNQRVKGDILPNSQGLIIGSDDGRVLWFKDSELGIESSPEIIKLGDSAVSSITVNPRESSVIAIGLGDRSSDRAEVSVQLIQ